MPVCVRGKARRTVKIADLANHVEIQSIYNMLTNKISNCCFASQVDRSYGDLSAVTVYWEVDPSSEGELLTTFGNITFGVDQISENITIIVAQDEIPELDKNFTVSLVNVSHGRLGDLTSATLTLLASDDPYGVFIFSNKTRSVRLPEADSTVSLTILRQKGLMGRVSSLDSLKNFGVFLPLLLETGCYLFNIKSINT